MVTGAYELLKALKEHKTQFHNNQNYVTIFKSWYRMAWKFDLTKTPPNFTLKNLIWWNDSMWRTCMHAMHGMWQSIFQACHVFSMSWIIVKWFAACVGPFLAAYHPIIALCSEVELLVIIHMVSGDTCGRQTLQLFHFTDSTIHLSQFSAGKCWHICRQFKYTFTLGHTISRPN